ncbi:MAG: hypothetical protein ACRC1K_23570 [Planctomycetia bacterium]
MGSLEKLPLAVLPKIAAGLGGLGEDEAALAVCQRLVDTAPRHHAGWFGVAFYRRRIGYPLAEVIDSLQAAVALAPWNESYRINLAACLAQLSRFDEAFAHVHNVRVADVECRCWLAALAPIFHANGDVDRWGECLEKLRLLDQRRPANEF